MRTSQLLGMLAACLLEPDRDDGLLEWISLGRYLRMKWGRAPQVHPVDELHEPANPATEPVTR